MARHRPCYRVTSSFEMADGRLLECRYYYSVDDFGDTDVSEPEYHLDGQEIDLDSLPKGLDVIAGRLFNNKFPYRIEQYWGGQDE